MAERRGRRLWERAVGKVERSGAPHREIAARHGVRVGTLRSWVYGLRREGYAAAAAPSDVRLLPCRRGLPHRCRRQSGLIGHFSVSPAPGALAQIPLKLR